MSYNHYAISLEEAIAQFQNCSIDEIYDYYVKNHSEGLKKSQRLCVYAYNEPYGGDQESHSGLFEFILPAMANIAKDFDNLDDTVLVLGNYTFDRARQLYYVPDYEFVCVDPFRIYTYFQNNHNLDYYQEPIEKLNHNKMYLCKFGKVNLRWHSYVLLNLLKDKGILNTESGLWTFVYEDTSRWHAIFNETLKKLRQIMPNTPKMTNSEFVSASNMLDDLPFGKKCITQGQFFYTGFPYDIKYHADTEFSLVRETVVFNSCGVFLTEKAWVPISIKHPVLLLGQPSAANYLEKSGYLAPDDFYLSKKFQTAKNYQQAQEVFDTAYNMVMDKSDDDMQHIADNNYQQFCTDVNNDIQKLLDLGPMIDCTTGSVTNALNILLRNHVSNNALLAGKPNNKNFDYNTINQLYPDK